MRVSIPVALSALPRPALFACGSLLTVTEPRPYHSLDPRPHRIGPRLPGSTAEQVVRRAGCHVLVVRENEREFVRNTKGAIGRYRRPRRR